MLRRESISSLCFLLLWMGGCPKRQTSKSLVVFVPAQAPRATAQAAPAAPAEPQVLVIEEPAPPPEPEPAETSPAQTPEEPTAQKRTRRPAHPETATEPDETSPQGTPETPSTEVPALEPRQSTAQETELHNQFQKLDQDIQQRFARLSGAQLSPNNRKALEDARTFYTEATRAVASGDLPRAVKLAQKASLLLAALE